LRNFQLLADFAKLGGEGDFAWCKLVSVLVARNLIADEYDHARNVAQAASSEHGNE